jgi:serine/threonine-protein kinase PpkA
METNFPHFNDFHLDRELGQSDDSSFFTGTENKTHRKCLIKLLNPIYNSEPGIVQHFIDEAKFFSELQQPYTIRVYHFGQEGGYFFTVYERPVVTLLDRLQQLTMGECTDLFQEMVKSLEYLHQQNYIHGHLTPSSIMFREDGSLAIMNLGAFIFQSYQNTLFDNPNVSPSTYFKSPEQCRNQPLDNRSDYYSLGAIFYTMLTKKPPYQADNTVGIIGRHIESPPPQLLPEHSRYQPLIDKMMSKDPTNRTQNARDILDWLGAGSGGQSSSDQLELDFNTDFSSNQPVQFNKQQSSSPYSVSAPQKQFSWKIFVPSIVFLLIALYFLFFRASTPPEGLQDNNRSRITSQVKGSKNISEPVKTAAELEFEKIEFAIEQGELSLAETKITGLIIDDGNKERIAHLKSLVQAKHNEHTRRMYSAQLAIAEAALNSDDIETAETALAQARKMMVDPQLIQLEQTLQLKYSAPSKTTDQETPIELLQDEAEDDRTYQRARMSRSKDRINEYLQKFPKGKHIINAQKLAKELMEPAQDVPLSNNKKTEQKKIRFFTLSEKPTNFTEQTLKAILNQTSFFEAARNPSGLFDNPLEKIDKNSVSIFEDRGLQRMWLTGMYGQSLTFSQAIAWVQSLNSQNIGGFSDWRLPTMPEAMALLRPQESKNALFSQTYFKQPEWIWTSDSFDQNTAWAVFFTKGIVDTYRKNDLLSTMAIRTSRRP